MWDIPFNTLREQLNTANLKLSSITEYPVEYIAYSGVWPFNDWKENSNAILKTEQALSQDGFALAFLDLKTDQIAENTFFPYQIPRIRALNYSKLPL